MSREATIQVTLTIRKDNINYSRSAAFSADVAGSKGPSPAAITATIAGTDVDFSQLVTPGLCWLTNLDLTNYVEYGIWDPTPGVFYPLGELLPGESFPLRLSRNIMEEYVGTGTGTSADVNKFRFKANGASCVVLVEAFEK